MKLLTIQNHKTIKGEAQGYLTGILYLDPRVKGICPNATPGCKAACLFTAGRGRMNTVQEARTKKTEWFLRDQNSFMVQLNTDIEQLQKQARKKGLIPCIRLNGTSDVDWFGKYNPEDEKTIFESFPSVQFYDYTKTPEILDKAELIPNYHVTFSRSEDNVHLLKNALVLSTENIAVVFKDNLPKRYLGRRVIDGDKNDLRFLDPKGVVVGLKTKGKAKKDTTGFVVGELPMLT